ncbi:Nucleotidyl transferase AbiEii toxin, Type IV TA system (plasmid) [Pararobbsia alpina]
MSRHEVAISAELLEQALSSVAADAVLVGGQALAVWVSHYGLNASVELEPGVPISLDADFLGQRVDVDSIAKKVRGKALFPAQRAITALVGQIEVSTGESEYVNIDVIHRVVGLEPDEIRRRASSLTWGDVCFQVMHPLDVLASRVENLKQLADKQNADGAAQARLAVLVAREYVLERLSDGDEKIALKAIERIATIAKSAAGRTASRDYGVDFRVGIPADAVKNEAFRNQRFPRLREELAHAAGLARSANLAPQEKKANQ